MRRKIKVLLLHLSKLGILNAFQYMALVLMSPRRTLIYVKVKNQSRKVWLRNLPEDRQILQQIFMREELKLELCDPPKLIIDGGANIGLSSLYLKLRYPNCSIHAIEPDIDNFRLLEKNLEGLSNIHCYQRGLWTSNEWLEITNPEAGHESFIVKECKKESNRAFRGITIPQIMMKTIYDRIDLLKLDIEGSEACLFSTGFEQWLGQVNHILVETHNWICKDSDRLTRKATSEMKDMGMRGEYLYFQNQKVNC